jgi:sugar/nucleoside kinase (ribokinase family)
MSLLVVGSVALDTVETPRERRERVLGGSASFFSSVASLVTPVRLVAVVGDDFPREHLEFFSTREIDLDGLQRVSGKTFHWSGRYLSNMVERETLDTQLNVFAEFRPALPPHYADSRYVFLANIDPGLQLDVLRQIKRPDLVAVDTMNFWLSGDSLGTLKQVLQRADVVFLNDEEARILSGHHNLVRAAAGIRRMGVDRVIIKRGDAGAMLFDEQGIFWAPAFPVEEVVDPTGAGDSFAGGFLAFLAHGGAVGPDELRQAMIFGSAAGSYAVEAFSIDRFRTLTRDELLARCQSLARLVEFKRVML